MQTNTARIVAGYHWQTYGEQPEEVATIGAAELPDAVIDAVQGAPRGRYQRSLIEGGHNWSGSSVIGKAGNYGARYHRSRLSLLDRINEALPEGYSAETVLLHGGSPRRWRRELIIRTPRGVHVW